jgi:hypothetical protein
VSSFKSINIFFCLIAKLQGLYFPKSYNFTVSKFCYIETVILE